MPFGTVDLCHQTSRRPKDKFEITKALEMISFDSAVLLTSTVERASTVCDLTIRRLIEETLAALEA